jgi:hypothetical protein
MSETKKRKLHSPEFKAKVGLEALRGIKTINEIGHEYGVHPVTVGQWKKEIQEHAKTLFENKRGPVPIVAYLDRGPAEYFDFYNDERPHQSLGHKTPYIVYRVSNRNGRRRTDRG